MGPWLTAAIFSVLPTGWVYKKLYSTTGGNSKNAAIVAGFTYVLCLLIVGSVLSLII